MFNRCIKDDRNIQHNIVSKKNTKGKDMSTGNFILDTWAESREVIAVPHQSKPYIITDENENINDLSTVVRFADDGSDRNYVINQVLNAQTHQGLAIARLIRVYFGE